LTESGSEVADYRTVSTPNPAMREEVISDEAAVCRIGWCMAANLGRSRSQLSVLPILRLTNAAPEGEPRSARARLRVLPPVAGAVGGVWKEVQV